MACVEAFRVARKRWWAKYEAPLQASLCKEQKAFDLDLEVLKSNEFFPYIVCRYFSPRDFTRGLPLSSGDPRVFSSAARNPTLLIVKKNRRVFPET